MGEIRPFTEEFSSDAADLYLRAMRGQLGRQSEALRKYFDHIFLCNPWVTPDIPSLVYLEKGKLAGFLGVIPRTMEFRGRAIRVAVTSQLMVDRERRQGAAGIELLRHLFRGPQDMSYTDGASDEVSAFWTFAGAKIARLYSLNWTRTLRPLGTVRSVLERAGPSGRLLKGISGLVAAPGDYLLSKLPLRALQPPKSPYSAKPASSEEIFDFIRETGWRESLKPVYQQPAFTWLVSEAAKASVLGEFRMMIVHGPDGVRCGWYIYYAKRGGAAFVLQIGVRRRDQFDAVLLALFRDAWEAGCFAIRGQAIPQFLTNLTNQFCLFRYPGSCSVVHARDPDIVNAVGAGEAALTRLDGECWLRFAVEDWT